MRQIRARIREKRGVDYTENEIQELANVKLEKFLDPGGVRSDLLEQYREGARRGVDAARTTPSRTRPSTSRIRGFIVWIRKLLQPILKLFFNPNPLIEALHMQSKLNDSYNCTPKRCYYELIHNLVLETTRLGIEVKNLKMRVESMSSRLDFDERRARALEGSCSIVPAPCRRCSRRPGGRVGRGRGLRPRSDAETGGAPCATAAAPAVGGAPISVAATGRRSAGRRTLTRRRTGTRTTATPAAYESAAGREPADRGASEPNES